MTGVQTFALPISTLTYTKNPKPKFEKIMWDFKVSAVFFICIQFFVDVRSTIHVPVITLHKYNGSMSTEEYDYNVIDYPSC